MPELERRSSPQLLQALVHKVHQHLGLDFSAERSAELLRRLQLLAVEQQAEDPHEWLQHLAFAEWDAALVQSLVPVFSVGETYFRRDAPTFDWLAQEHLASLIARRRQSGQRSLRLWSAGCCTGEEAYSLLFLLDDLLGSERNSWTIELIASDISKQFLARAEQAVYGSNAFRRNETVFRQRYFEAEGRSWRVRQQWRGRIRFIQYNFMDELPSSLCSGVDLLLCRNVLMYFSTQHAPRVLKRLLGSLDPEGLLLLGAVEASIATQAGLSGSWAGCNYALRGSALATARSALERGPLGQAGSAPQADSELLQRRPAAPIKLPPANLPLPPPSPEPQAAVAINSTDYWQQAQHALSAQQYAQAREALQAYLACTGLSRSQQQQACLLLARSWADQQHLEQAQQWLQRALQLQPDDAMAYWLQAQLAQHQGEQADALGALHKALYLEPDFILAHFLQAQLLAAQGQRQGSARALRICRQLLQAQDAEALVPHGEGISCAQLLRLCEQLMQEADACPSP